MENLVKILKEKNKTISSMESCTGGLFASELTNVDGSSNVFNLGLVTYSNNWKEYFGVNKEIINTYTVYSTEVAKEMAKSVCNLAKTDFGIGITGQIGLKDFNNESENLNTVYICIYNKDNNYFNYVVEPIGKNKLEKKKFIINYIKEKLYDIC